MSGSSSSCNIANLCKNQFPVHAIWCRRLTQEDPTFADLRREIDAKPVEHNCCGKNEQRRVAIYDDDY